MIVGLGNPGLKYERTRHNVGFLAIDEIARRIASVTAWKTKDDAAQIHVADRAVVLVKPLAFMNASGVPLVRIAQWWKIHPRDMLVISDDLDLPLGRLRLRASGSSGGQNGLRSIIERFGEDFPRLRVGIGRGGRDAIDHVLAPFSSDEAVLLADVLDGAATGAVTWLDHGIGPASTFTNSRRPPTPPEPTATDA